MKLEIIRIAKYIIITSLLFIVSACGGGSDDDTEKVITPIGDITGTWQVTGTISSPIADCDDGALSMTATIVQTGNKITATGSDGSLFSGTINGNKISMTGRYPEDGGTTTSLLTATLTNDCNQFSGNEKWSWTDGSFSCSGNTTLTGDNIAGSGCGVIKSSGLVKLTTNAASDVNPD